MTDTVDRSAPPPASSPPAVRVRNLKVDFWVNGDWYPAVKNANFDVSSGEALAIVGESGSGKSTIALAMMGLLPKNAAVRGSIHVGDTEVVGLDKRSLRSMRGRVVSMIFQEPMTALNPVYTVGFQIAEMLRSHQSMSPRLARKRAIELLELVEIPNPEQRINAYPHQLSGGQRQRAMIAQALACDPSVLVADEPTTALDVTVQAEILKLIRDLRDRIDAAIVLITHDMGVVADLADRVMVMEKGDVVEQGAIADVFQRPQHAYTQQLLAAVPHLGSISTAEAESRRRRRVPRSPRPRRRPTPSRPGRARPRPVSRSTNPPSIRTARAPWWRCAMWRSSTPSGADPRRSAPSTASRCRSRPVRWSDWSGSRAPARPPSAAPSWGCCHSSRARRRTRP